MSDVAFEAKGLSKRFGRRTVLDGLDLTVHTGEVLVLLGENGAGKSTLMRCALGLLRPDGGTLTVLGRDPVRQAAEVRDRVGYVPDVPDVLPWMTVPDLFAFLRPHYKRWSDVRAAELVEALRVPMDVAFRHLSRGQGMKAMLAAALAPDPELLLLDEPFAGLDPVVREDVLKGVVRGLDGAQRTVICATHELDAAARIADRVAILSGGKIERVGTVSEVVGAAGEEEPADVPQRLAASIASVLAAAGRVS